MGRLLDSNWLFRCILSPTETEIYYWLNKEDLLAQTHKQRIGTWGERVAADYLGQRGFRLLARNVRTPHGEIDLVMQTSVGELVFVEVKTRTNASFGLPEEAVDARKLDHLFHAAEFYLQDHADLEVLEWRIDAVAIQGKPGDRVQDVYIEHFENISA